MSRDVTYANDHDPFDGIDPFEPEPAPPQDRDDRLLAEMDERIPFGAHRGTPIKKLQPGYVTWLLEKATHGWVDDYREALEFSLTYVDESSVPEYRLEEDQQQAADYIARVLFGDQAIARLQGGAGYGKSFTVQDIALRARRAGYIVRAAATSYVATNNLAKDLDPIGVETKTIASLLRLDVVYSGPREIYQPGPDTYPVLADILDRGNLLIIDEYSMVSDTIGRTLIDAAHQHGGKLLVVGDAQQLPSPEQSWDSILCHVDPAAELWLPKRYRQDSTLYQVERTVRAQPLAFRADPYLGDEVYQARTIDNLFDRYCESREAHPDDQHLVIYYRRAHMAQANRDIRKRLFGGDAPDLCEGEQLRVQRTADFTPYYAGDGERVYSGTTIVVTDVHPSSRSIHVVEADMHFDVPCWYVDGHLAHKPDEVFRAPVLFSITENQCEPSSRGGAEFNHAIRLLAQWCQDNNSWKPYRNFRNCFVQVAYQYASTVHRVQGQSVDRVFTSPAAMRQADPYTAGKLMYVALTRAKKALTVL